MSNKILFLIPARGGSKGLPGKNTRILNKKPLIHWTIKAALESGIKGDVVVSTDDKKIAAIAKKSGAQVPYLRPKHLSGDHAKSIDVILHHIEFARKNNIEYTHVVLLQPTSPLRTGKNIKEAFQVLNVKKGNSVISVYPNDHNPNWTNTLPKNGSMHHFLSKNHINKNRQQIGKFYTLNGAIYIIKVKTLEKYKSVFTPKSYAYVMDNRSSVDIDTLLDFEFAEFLMKKKN